MAKLADKCYYCGKLIFFGATRKNGYTFCNSRCREAAYQQIAAHISEDYIREQVRVIHSSACPRCNGSGPTDVHMSHCIMSAIIFSFIQSTPHICCRKCGRIEQLKDLLASLFLGWWGFPWGILMTPIQIIRNLIGLVKRVDPSKPSNKLYTLILQQNEMNIMQSTRNE
jgi:hypothetical protein